MARSRLAEYDRDQLLEEIDSLKKKLNKKRNDLVKTKSRVVWYRDKMQKMKATIDYQRSRILQLYRENVGEV